MKQIPAIFLVLALAVPASAGPLARDAASAARQAAQKAEKAPEKNRYLWPSLALMGGGTAMALVGFLHRTPHSIDPALLTPEILTANPYLAETLLLEASSSRNTSLAVAGLGMAGFGGVLFAIGQKHKAAQPKLSLCPRRVVVTNSIRF